MNSQIQKNYPHGFDLSREQLQRLHDSLVQQVRKATSEGTARISIDVWFRNRVIIQSTTLAEVLALENGGENAITFLLIKVLDRIEDPRAAIQVSFMNVDTLSLFESLYLSTPITYRIEGHDQDWVSVTRSIVEERIRRISRIAPSSIKALGWVLIPLVIAFLALAAFAYQVAGPLAYPRPASEVDELTALEAKWKSGELSDPIAAVFEMKKLELRQDRDAALWYNSTVNRQLKSYAFTLGLLVLIAGAILFWWYFFPPYNFLWGEYAKFVRKRMGVGAFLLTAILVAIVVSVLGNYLTDFLKDTVGIGKSEVGP